jgi:hypothetical protein
MMKLGCFGKAGYTHKNENPGYTTMTWVVLPAAFFYRAVTDGHHFCSHISVVTFFTLGLLRFFVGTLSSFVVKYGFPFLKPGLISCTEALHRIVAPFLP